MEVVKIGVIGSGEIILVVIFNFCLLFIVDRKIKLDKFVLVGILVVFRIICKFCCFGER